MKGFLHVFILSVGALLSESSLPGCISGCLNVGTQKKTNPTSCISISMQVVIMHTGFAFWCVIGERSMCLKSMKDSYLSFSNFYSIQLCFHANGHGPFIYENLYWFPWLLEVETLLRWKQGTPQRAWDQTRGKASVFVQRKADVRHCFMLGTDIFCFRSSWTQRDLCKKREGTYIFCWLGAFLWVRDCVANCSHAFAKGEKIPPAQVVLPSPEWQAPQKCMKSKSPVFPKHWIVVLADFKDRLQASIYSLSIEGDICFIFLVNCHL